MRNICRGIAQLVEQRSPKPRAVSSSLTTPAKTKTCKAAYIKRLQVFIIETSLHLL